MMRTDSIVFNYNLYFGSTAANLCKHLVFVIVHDILLLFVFFLLLAGTFDKPVDQVEESAQSSDRCIAYNAEFLGLEFIL